MADLFVESPDWDKFHEFFSDQLLSNFSDYVHCCIERLVIRRGMKRFQVNAGYYRPCGRKTMSTKEKNDRTGCFNGEASFQRH